MNLTKQLSAIVAAAGLFPLVAVANPAPSGDIIGRIVDPENHTLPGAIVIIDNRAYSAVTDVDGNFRISGIIPGEHIIKVSYLGFEPHSNKIIVKADENLVYNIVMNDITTQLGEVVVNGVFSAQQRAINTQRANINVSNIVSSDHVGKFPDSNVGDALKRISGINVQYDQGEARFGQIRGTSPDLSSVTINGSRLPSAEGDIRNVQLDLIPSDMIQAIEVNKVVTSDQDGDAIGGSINLITKSAPFKRFLKATAGSGYNWISRKAQLNLGLTFGSRFFDDKLGVVVAGSFQNAPAGSYNTEFEWERDNNGNPYVADYQIRRYYVTRERQSYSLSLDYNLNQDNSLWFKGIFNNRNDWENRYRTTLKDLDADGNATVRVQTKGGTPDNRNARLEKQQTMDFSFGGDHRFGIFGMEWKAGYARASEDRPNERYIDYQKKKQHFKVDISDPREPFATPTDGSTMLLNDSFSLKELTQQQEEIREEDLKLAADFTADLNPISKIKFGAKIVNKTKRKDIDFYEYSPLDEDAFNADAFRHITDQQTSRFMPSDKYNPGVFIDKEFLGGLDLDNPSIFEKEQVAEELAGNYKARETVTAGYIRFDTRLVANLHLVAGLRVENTDLKYTGRIFDADEETVTPTDPSKSNYINFLPSLLLKWNVNDDFILRGSYTKTLARPKYAALVPGMNIKSSDNELTIGNPNLNPTISHNIDLNTEYYFKSVGLAGLSLFYKHIKGFIVDEVRYNSEYLGNVWTSITQPKNAGNANLFGVEVSLQRDFGFITPALKCLGFYGTYTYTHTRVSDFNLEGREDEKGLSLPGSPEHTANASLAFDKAGFNIRLSYNFASSFIDEMGESSFYDRFYDSVNYLDLNASYTFGKKVKVTIFAEANNLLNQPLRYYQGVKDRTMQQEYYGARVNAGIKIGF